MTFLGTARDGDELRAEGRVIHADATTGLAEAFVTRGDGAGLAHGTSRGFILRPLLVSTASRRPSRPPAEPEYETPDPVPAPGRGRHPQRRDDRGDQRPRPACSASSPATCRARRSTT